MINKSYIIYFLILFILQIQAVLISELWSYGNSCVAVVERGYKENRSFKGVMLYSNNDEKCKTLIINGTYSDIVYSENGFEHQEKIIVLGTHVNETAFSECSQKDIVMLNDCSLSENAFLSDEQIKNENNEKMKLNSFIYCCGYVHPNYHIYNYNYNSSIRNVTEGVMKEKENIIEYVESENIVWLNYEYNKTIKQFQNSTEYPGCEKFKITVSNKIATIQGYGTLRQSDVKSLQNEDLDKIIVEEGVTELGIFCFSGFSTKELILPMSLRKLGSRCFASMRNIQTLRIPPLIDRFDVDYIDGCSSLKDLILMRPSGYFELTGFYKTYENKGDKYFYGVGARNLYLCFSRMIYLEKIFKQSSFKIFVLENKEWDEKEEIENLEYITDESICPHVENLYMKYDCEIDWLSGILGPVVSLIITLIVLLCFWLIPKIVKLFDFSSKWVEKICKGSLFCLSYTVLTIFIFTLNTIPFILSVISSDDDALVVWVYVGTYVTWFLYTVRFCGCTKYCITCSCDKKAKIKNTLCLIFIVIPFFGGYGFLMCYKWVPEIQNFIDMVKQYKVDYNFVMCGIMGEISEISVDQDLVLEKYGKIEDPIALENFGRVGKSISENFQTLNLIGVIVIIITSLGICCAENCGCQCCMKCYNCRRKVKRCIKFVSGVEIEDDGEILDDTNSCSVEMISSIDDLSTNNSNQSQNVSDESQSEGN